MSGSDEIIFDAPPKWQGAIGAAAALSVFLVMAYFGLEGAGRIAAVSVASLGAATRISWPLRHRPWFWVVMSCIAIMHLAVVVLYPWSNERYPGFTLIPVMIADIAVILCILALIAKTGGKNR